MTAGSWLTGGFLAGAYVCSHGLIMEFCRPAPTALQVHDFLDTRHPIPLEPLTGDIAHRRVHDEFAVFCQRQDGAP